ncbi:NADH-quinone oxidoreductase subunit NuoF family protein [Phytohabitans rumicis]|nr:NADH-quinone oxidoreductase subunit NuoF family protein [Phytohabitans rumicis]
MVPAVGRAGPARLTAGFEQFGRLDLYDHQQVHGDLRPMSSADLISLAEQIKLTGRGGAAFPFARKVRAVIDSAMRQDKPIVVVVNATEGEPAAWKDKVLLARAPHLILDGASLAAWALEAEEIVIGVEGEHVGHDSLRQALAERRMPAPTRIVAVPHRFISGEGGALVRGINGEAHIPPGRKIRSSDSGVDGLPTLLSNAETYAQLAYAATVGPYEYAAVGTAKEPGTVMLTITAKGKPSVVEAPTGVPLKEVLRMCGTTPGQGLLLGGYHGKWITAEAASRAEISRESLTEVGGTLGAGIMVPLPDDTCPLGEVARVMHYMAAESAGQCGPCRLGLPDLARTVSKLVEGGGGQAAVRAAAGVVKGRGACSHPDGTSRFALSALEVFAEDIAAHAFHDGCGRPVKGILPLTSTPEKEETVGGVGKLVVDWTRCDGHGLCAHLVPELIRLDGNGYPAIADTPVPAWLEADARRAVDMCPGLALRLTGVAPKEKRKTKPKPRQKPLR